ncbi:branched-chain alpha-ketoacid dehydrogenase [Xylaria sp. FL0933]|nr:branched-chain alpha-ketoacid dehydrogenase [Xylaria sp. FL0933]
MPTTYIVTCKEDASPEQVAEAKKHATDQGGKITHEYNLIKGFAVEIPDDTVNTLESHPHIKGVEKDQETITVTDEAITDLANKQQHSLSLADLVKHGRPPLSEKALLASANFTLNLLPIRLAHRIQALRNLPFIVVADPNVSRIYNNYVQSLSTLLPWKHRTISTLEEEIQFTSVLAELVATHQDTIPILAKGFIQCRRYISPEEVTRFLNTHLRTRIGTRLIAEQHIALHYSSVPHFDPGASPTPCPEHPNYIGVIDTALSPAAIVDSCAGFVADICEFKYGVRPKWVIDGEPDTVFTFVPMHLEYIVTELLKNAFRATVESGSKEHVVITIAPEPPDAGPPNLTLDPPAADKGAFRGDAIRPLDDNAPGVTIRIRDRGGGISPDILPNIWNYSFTTFNEDDVDDVMSNNSNGGNGRSQADALGIISAASSGASSIAGLGYGLPLSRAYAEYFGGGIAVQSLYGWGTDVYLRLKGVGRIQ